MKHLFKKRFEITSYYCLVSNIFLVFFIGLEDIKDKKVSKCIQNLEKNMMKLFIMLSKTLCFFILEESRIVGYCCNFIISKKARFLVWFSTDSVE